MQDKQEDAQKLVSFIIPTYNVGKEMLHECINSILSLSLRPFEREIILVDDGSDTSPLGHLSDCINELVYIRQANAGLSAARNRGVQMAQGEYLQFVDADDMLIQAPYEHCLDLVRYKHPDMVLFDFTSKMTAQTLFNDLQPMSGTEYMRNYNLRGSACGYIFRRKALSQLRFTKGIYHEDEEFTPQLLLRADTIYATDAQAYFYRKHPSTITTSTDKRRVIKRLNDVHGALVRLNRLASTLPVDERTALSRRVAQLTMDYIYKMIVETRDRQYLDRQLKQLEDEGLFPLPDRDYTQKYTWFRRMTNSSIGLSMLMRTLPLLKKER